MQIVNYLYTLQGEAAGAQALSNFDSLLAPFIRYDGLNYKDVKQEMHKFLFNMNVPTRVGFQSPFSKMWLLVQGYWDSIQKTESKKVEQSLKAAALWPEVSDKLHGNALSLALGQQQRLCIARVLAVQPEVILMDEPCSALDPIATRKIEELMQELKKDYTIVIVTHNMQQAARASDWTGFVLMGELLEYGVTGDIFTRRQQFPRRDAGRCEQALEVRQKRAGGLGEERGVRSQSRRLDCAAAC